jgi:hypothetical protein
MLAQFSTANGLELRAVAVQTTSLSHLAHYKQLEWRLDVQVPIQCCQDCNEIVTHSSWFHMKLPTVLPYFT